MEQRHPRRLALIVTIILFSLIGLLVREFPILSNTMGAGSLVIASMLTGLLLSSFAVWHFRERFKPWDRHFPDVALVLVPCIVFAPLFGSLLNRGLGKTTSQTFEFVSELPFYASGYGMLKGEKAKASGYHLQARQNGKQYRFKYKSQAYYPNTKPGEKIMLPVREGFFGANVMLLK